MAYVTEKDNYDIDFYLVIARYFVRRHLFMKEETYFYEKMLYSQYKQNNLGCHF